MEQVVLICMATYNGGKFIREQVDSILNQQFVENKDVELELVVSDDGSTDNTIDILKSYQDQRIKVFLHSNKKKYKILIPSNRYHNPYAEEKIIQTPSSAVSIW